MSLVQLSRFCMSGPRALRPPFRPIVNQFVKRMYTLYVYADDTSTVEQICSLSATTGDHIFDVKEYLSRLRASRYGKPLVYSPLCSSTQTVMQESFPTLPVGTVVVADAQNCGKGRGSNVWVSPKGQLAFSFKCALAKPDHMVFVQYLISLCVVKVCNNVLGVEAASQIDAPNAVRMKWPNDIYAKRLKIGGILCNSSYLMETKQYHIVCGIGLNVHNGHPTTCLADLWPECSIKREAILASFFDIFEPSWERFQTEGFEPFMTDYLDNWLHTNEELVLEGDGGREPVRVAGLTSDGFLLGIGRNGQRYALHPDQNSLDLFQGLLKKKM